MQPTRYVRPKKNNRSNLLVWVLLAAFLIAALLTAYMTFIFVRGIITARALAGGEGISVTAPDATAAPLDPELLVSPLQASGGPAPQPWDKESRVNVLLMGTDYRDWEGGGPSRTDTMILLTLDPQTQTAGMLSIPRDLWVNIPGFGYGKINTAHFLGEAYGMDGDGPGLAMQTVEQLLGVPVQYYAKIDFSAFEGFINELGGIEIDVPETIEVDPIGPDNTVVLQPGPQLITGPTALAYARSRNTIGNDFDRAQRQQQVILAIRSRILNLNMLPLLIQKAPILYDQLSAGVHTNLTLEQVMTLAWYAQQIEAEKITRAAIGPDQVIFDYSPEGLDILRPIPEEVRLISEQIFTTSGPALPAAPTGNPQEMREAENARVSVLNGTFTPGLAALTSTYLAGLGINVVETGNASEVYQYTTIIDYTGKTYTSQYLVEQMGIQPSQVFSSYDPNKTWDITVILGEDWATENPIP